MLETLRSHILKLYSVVFAYPDERLSTWIVQGNLDELFEISLPLKEPVLTTYHQWTKSNSNSIKLLEELQTEYTRLFINAYPHLLAPPYAAFYREKTLFGDTTEEIIALYNQYQFRVSDRVSEMPDHISIMLEFLYRLVENSVPSREIKKIVQKHYMGWIPQWVARIEAHASLPFYILSGKSLVKFLKNEF